MIGRKRRVGLGAAVGVVLLGAILVGMVDELTKEAEKLLGDLFGPHARRDPVGAGARHRR